MIYFVQRSDGRIKIGFTARTVESRMKSIATGAGSLALLATIEGGRDVELALHERFADRRVDREWFGITPEDVSEVVASYRVRRATGGVFKRGNVYWLRLRVDGVDARESADTASKVVARRKLAKRIQELTAGMELRPRLVREAVTARSPLEEANAEITELRRQLYRAGLEMESVIRRHSARATLESAPAESIADVLDYVISRVERQPVGFYTEELAIWRSAASAAREEWERRRAVRANG